MAIRVLSEGAMGLKDLLVYVDQTLRLAADLASRDSSRLTALYVRKWSRASSRSK